MKKFWLLLVAAFSMQAFAAVAVEREGFTATDGARYYLRAATPADIDGLPLGLSEAVRQDRRARATAGHFGVWVIERENGEYAGRLLTGRMPLGVQPWPCASGSPDERRLGIIITFYEWLLSLHGIVPDHANVVRNTAPDMRIELVNNAVHAATVVFGEAPFNTVAVQDALARLAVRLGTTVAPDANITPAGVPSLIISTSTVAPDLPAASTSRIFQMPYYTGRDGMRYTTVTDLAGAQIPALPANIAEMLATYTASHYPSLFEY